MFTGIIEELGVVVSRIDTRLVVRCPGAMRDAAVGDSIAVSGTCLTIVDRGLEEASFDLSEETLARTGLGRLSSGDLVNLERSVTLASRLGGHLVQGHVDGVGELAAARPDADGGVRLFVRLPSHLLRYVVQKGSVTLDGVSLTVAALEGDVIEIALVPHTLDVTTFGVIETGDLVNVEVDVVAKYVERLMTVFAVAEHRDEERQKGRTA